MLSLASLQCVQYEYYQRLAGEDYYLKGGGEPVGIWLGSGAARLGLTGPIRTTDLAQVFLGFSPGGDKLVQNAAKRSRKSGWDATYSVPKSVSAIWAVADDDTRQAIQQSHGEAVRATVQYIEDNFAFSRVGRGGTERVKVGLIIAAYEHGTSRAADPQLHCHTLILNGGIDQAGRSRAILSKPLYQNKMLLGAYFRCELAHQLRSRLGLELECPLDQKGQPVAWFEVKGAPRKFLRHLSKRRRAIEKELGERGLESASAAAFAALATRPAKSLVPPRGELFARWRTEAQAFHFHPEAILGRARCYSPQAAHRKYRRALAEAVATITTTENYFTQEQLTRSTLERAQPFGLKAPTVAKAVATDIRTQPTFVSLGVHQGQPLWTTTEVLACERQFLDSVAELRRRRFDPVPARIVEEALTKKRGEGANAFYLDESQQEAVRYICGHTASIKTVSGLAGTGKTEMLAVANDALTRAGYHVMGVTLAGIAAKGLEEKSGIPSDTVRMREIQLNPTLADQLTHHAQQLGRAAVGKPTWTLPSCQIDRKTVLVVDEASLVGTRDFAMLADAVVKGGGSLLCVGDHRQLPAIERGGCFTKLHAAIQGASLTEIRRQQDPTDRTAVEAMVEGRPEEVLRHYAAKGQFYMGRTREEAERELLTDWCRNGGLKQPAAHRIFAGTRAEVARLNALAQAERVRAGVVDATQQVEHNEQVFCVDDRVRFTKAARSRGICNGDAGTIVACRAGAFGKYLAVALDKETPSWTEYARAVLQHHGEQLLNAALGRATIPPPPRHDILVVAVESRNPFARTYDGLELDYCLTAHRSQGMTAAHSYVYLGSAMHRELAYVESSRHRETLYLYGNELEVGQPLTECARQTRPISQDMVSAHDELPGDSLLIQQMNRSRAKQLAATLLESPRPSPEIVYHV